MDDLNRWVLLYDYYGDFLTQKQQRVFEMYYQNDLSLGEIAEITGTTRQGVHDMVRRSQDALDAYENTLGMVDKFFKIESQVKEIVGDLQSLETQMSDEGKDILKKVYCKLNLLLQEGGE